MIHDASTQAALDLIPATPKTVLYFSADWCGPCQFTKPALEAMSVERPDINFVRVDVDADGDLSRKYAIRGIPTVIVIDEDGMVQRLNGNAIPAQLPKYL